MSLRHFGFAGALAIAIASVPASAAVVFSQTPVINTATWSDVDSFGYRVADDFTIGGAETIRSVIWRGMYYASGTPQAVDAFTLNFYADAGGGVGALLGSFNVGNAVNRVDTGLDFDSNVDFYEYTADLGAGMSLGSGTYWLSVFNDTTADTDDGWYWGTLTSSGNNRLSSDGGVNFSANLMTSYFILDNAGQGGGGTVPEPTTLLLVGLGFAGLRLSRRA